MKKNTKTIKTTQRVRTMAVLTERALTEVGGGEDGVIHAQRGVSGRSVLPDGISGSGR